MTRLDEKVRKIIQKRWRQRGRSWEEHPKESARQRKAAGETNYSSKWNQKPQVITRERKKRGDFSLFVHKVSLGLERWFSSQEQGYSSRPGFSSQHPPPSPVCNCSLRGSDVLFWPSQAPGMHKVHTHTCRQSTYTHKVNVFEMASSSFRCWDSRLPSGHRLFDLDDSHNMKLNFPI